MPHAKKTIFPLFLALISIAILGPVKSQAQRAGDFDYYLLALSWSPSYCADDARKGRDRLQCFSERAYGFVIHGLWPQYERGTHAILWQNSLQYPAVLTLPLENQWSANNFFDQSARHRHRE